MDGSMFNPRLAEALTDYPFARLNALIADVKPPAHLPLINLSVGEPQGALPAFARKILADEIEGWSRYPPNQGIPDLNLAIVEWLNRRYRLPPGLLDARSEEHTSELQSRGHLVCRLLLEKKKEDNC